LLKKSVSASGNIRPTTRAHPGRALLRADSNYCCAMHRRDWQCGDTPVDFNCRSASRRPSYIAGTTSKEHARDDPLAPSCGLTRAFIGTCSSKQRLPTCRCGAPRSRLVVLHHPHQHSDASALEYRRRGEEAWPAIRTALRNEKINYKVREPSGAKVPFLVALDARKPTKNPCPFCPRLQCSDGGWARGSARGLVTRLRLRTPGCSARG